MLLHVLHEWWYKFCFQYVHFTYFFILLWKNSVSFTLKKVLILLFTNFFHFLFLEKFPTSSQKQNAESAKTRKHSILGAKLKLFAKQNQRLSSREIVICIIIFSGECLILSELGYLAVYHLLI